MSETTKVISVLPIQARQGYMPQLDGLRAFAVLAVLYTHFLPKQYWLLGVYWGGVGVSLFFVLSGFLITRILLRDKALLVEIYVFSNDQRWGPYEAITGRHLRPHLLGAA